MGKFNLGEFARTLSTAVPSAPAEAVPRTIEAVTGEILEAKRTGGEAILTIGRCLMEAKGLLSHGEWLPWLNEQVELSERAAQRFMRLAREWSNPTALSDLGATKALTLLALPPEEREQFIAEVHEVGGEEKSVIDMSARELEQAIRERDEARKAAEAAQAEARNAEEARAKMEADMAVVNVSLAAANAERDQADQEIARLERELTELKNRPVEVAVEKVIDQDAIEAARREAVAGMQAKLDKAREAKEKAEARRKNAEESLEQIRRQLEEQARAEKKAALSADKDVAQFEVFFNQGQEIANKLRGLLLRARGREDQSAAHSMEKALRALAEAIGRCAE